MTSTTKEKEKEMAKNLQTHKIEEGEPIDRNQLYNLGQTKRSPYVLAAEEKEAVIIKKDKTRTPRYGPTASTHIAIVEGECNHCGSNRLETGYKEPAGVNYVSCPVCNRDNMSSGYEFNYSLD